MAGLYGKVRVTIYTAATCQQHLLLSEAMVLNSDLEEMGQDLLENKFYPWITAKNE